uniref:AAA domain-containing protein n=2 Tax=Mesocestoides corti TaxID=53468 RepID=A0A5K3FDT1_MESCO
MDNTHGYNFPQVQRKFLIPLAESFLAVAEDSSSLQEFLDFVICDGKTNCTKENVRNWRKDALKALRLANAKIMMTEDVPETPRESKRMLDADETMDTSTDTLAPKKPKLSSFSQLAISCYVPTLSTADIADTVPSSLLKQAKIILKCHLFSTDLPDVWPTVLLNGPPFCGKTTLIKAIAGTLNVNFLSVSVGMLTPTIRTWREIFTQAKTSAPCILHIDDIESMEKQNAPAGSFRVTCLLKSQLLSECVGAGVAVVGETRSLLASLPQPVTDLFTNRITFGMMEEKCRLSLLSRFFVDEQQTHTTAPNNGTPALEGTSTKAKSPLQLSEGLTVCEIAHRTPGYEAGDLIRLVLAIRMELMAEAEEASPDTATEPNQSANVVTRDLVDIALSQVIPAVKNTSEFVTIPDVTWADVGGLEETKTHLYNRFMLLVDDWERAQALRRRSSGILLEGPPGCGKTLIAKALSNTAGLNFLSVKGPEILNKFQGESERRIREIFERGRACQPCLIFFDEIDAICPRRDGDESSGSRVSVVNQLLVELDGVDKHRQARVFVVGATNRKDMIDEAVLRPGRLGLHLVIPPPASARDRADVLSACTRKATTPRIEGGLEVLQRVAEDPRTDGMSGADLENLLDTAKQNAQLAKRDFLIKEDLETALAELKK